MNTSNGYVAVDWGTTNRRAYLISEDGMVLDTHADDRGVLSMNADDYASEVLQFRQRWNVESVIIAGMAGSSRGWIEAPYVPCPADADLVASGMVISPLDNVWLVPGVAQNDDQGCDVMRGEEVQILGALYSDMAPANALFCQPGTHNKWIEARQGMISRFTTVMTGELFSLLRSKGTLAEMLEGKVNDTTMFRHGVRRGHEAHTIGAMLFEVRASVLLGQINREDAAAYASGLLIGNDIAVNHGIEGRKIYLLGSGSLADLYIAAMEALGAETVLLDSHQAFVAGIHLLKGKIQ